MLVIFLLLFCVFSIILGGGGYYIYGLPKPKSESEPESEPEPDEEELKTIQDKAYDREMKEIVTDMTDEKQDTSAKQQKLAVALKALERAKFNAGNVGNAFKTVSEASKKLAEAKAQILVYEGLSNTSTDDDEKAIWQQAVDQTQKKIDFFQATYDEAKKGADEAVAALREKAAAEKVAAEERVKLAEQRRVEAAAASEAARKAKALATLKDGCKNVVWNNVFVDGRVGVDVTYANGRSISATPANSTGLTKGNAKVTVTTAKKTIFSRREQTGRNSRGVPEYSWKSKAEYDGIVKISGSKVGYTKMKKKPNSQQPSSCKRIQPMKYNCQFESDGFEELHDFNDTTKPLILMHHKGYTGVMQGETGEFYSFQDKKVIGNPYSSDCQTKLDYK